MGVSKRWKFEAGQRAGGCGSLLLLATYAWGPLELRTSAENKGG